MTRTLAIVIAAVLLASPLSACGKKGDPKPPNADSTYPKQYPKPGS